MKQDEKRIMRVLYVIGIIPIIWIALLLAPYTKGGLIEIIKNDFIQKFDNCSTNQEIHNLIFGRNIRTISLYKKNGENDPYVSYRVLDTDYSKDCRNNEITVINYSAYCNGRYIVP